MKDFAHHSIGEKRWKQTSYGGKEKKVGKEFHLLKLHSGCKFFVEKIKPQK